MENNETKTLWISIGAAVFAVFLLYSWSQEQTAAMHKKFGSKQQVVIAAKDIDEMQPIDESMLEVSESPTDFVQPKAIKSPDVAIGQLAAAPIKKGEQILDTKLLLPGRDTGLSMQVTPGKRAISIAVDETRGLSKLLKPGDHIDLLVAMDTGTATEKKREVRTLMQDVTILACGQNIVDTVPATAEEDGKDGYLLTNLRKVYNFTNITIEATPSEIQQITYIVSVNAGSLYPSLRNPNDRYINALKTVEVDDVMGRVKAPRVPAEAPAVKPAPVAAPAAKKSGMYEEL